MTKETIKIKLSCKICGKEFYRYPKQIKKYNACSLKCSNKYKSKHISKKRKGMLLSKITKQKISEANKGSKSYLWKGGKPKCKVCGKEIDYNSIHCVKHNGIGKKLSDKHKISISNGLVGIMPKNILRAGKFNNIKRGWYKIGNKKMFFRSKWEANYAIYLNFLMKQKEIKKWEYEKDMFLFDKIISGTRTYRPDFKVFNNNGKTEYHEVKGWMDAKSKTKLKRMKIYYPQIKMILIDKFVYADIKNKVGGLLKFY